MTKHALEILGVMWIVVLVACGGGSQQQTITPAPPLLPLVIASVALPSGTVGSPYAGNGFSLAASGGVGPYTWTWTAASSSSLPAGLNLSSSGLISGTPQAAVKYLITVTVTDSASRPAHANADYQITVAAALTITSGAPPNGTVGVDYGPTTTQQVYCYDAGASVGARAVCRVCASTAECAAVPRCIGSGNVTHPLPCHKLVSTFHGFTFNAAGGTSPYTWSASGMPPGLDVDPNSGEILGTPTVAGSYSVLITLSDSASPSDQASGTYVIDIS